MKSLSITIILSLFIVFASAEKICTDLFTNAVQNLHNFKTNFLSHNYDGLSNDLQNIYNNTQAIQEICGEFTILNSRANSDILPREPRSCSHLYTLILGLMKDSVFETLNDISLLEELPFVLEEIVDFTLQITETDCLNEWKMNFGQQDQVEMDPTFEDVHKDVYFEILFDEEDFEGEVLGVFIDINKGNTDDEDIDAVALAVDDIDDEKEPIIEIEDGEDALGVFVPIYASNDQEDENEDTLSVYVPYYPADDEEDDSLSVYVPLEASINVENGEVVEVIVSFDETLLEVEDENEDDISVFVPYNPNEVEEDSVVISSYVSIEEVPAEEEPQIEDEDDVVVFVPYYSSGEEEEDSISVYVPIQDNIEGEVNEEDIINVIGPEDLSDTDGDEERDEIMVFVHLHENDAKNNLEGDLEAILIEGDGGEEDAIGVFVPLTEL